MAKWVQKWDVQSESNPQKFYTVSRAEDGMFGCSCPAWIFHKRICKHIRGVAEKESGASIADPRTTNKLRLISKLHHLTLGCENCKFGQEAWRPCTEGHLLRGEKQPDLLLVKSDAKTFYILGRCCIHYEKAPDA